MLDNMVKRRIAEILRNGQPAQAVMIGDTVFDMAMAKQARVPAVGVDWGYHQPAKLLAAGAGFVASNPAELQAFMLQ